MRIVNRKTFLQLPVPVVFARLDDDDNIGPLEIANEMLPAQSEDSDGDFYTVWLDDPAKHPNETSRDSTVWRANGFARMHAGESRPMAESCSRDGLYDAHQLFVIYEPRDLTKIRESINAAIGAQS